MKLLVLVCTDCKTPAPDVETGSRCAECRGTVRLHLSEPFKTEQRERHTRRTAILAELAGLGSSR